MNDMEKCFYEPAELSVVDEGKGRSLVREKGSPYKLGFLVAQAADGIFKSLGDADAVDAMERVIVSTIRVMAMQRKAEFKKGTDAFDMSGGFNAVRDEGAPCDGYNLNCEHYEKTNKGAADTKHLSR